MSVSVENVNRSRSLHENITYANTTSKKSNGCLSLQNDYAAVSKNGTPEKDNLSLIDYSFHEHDDSRIAANKDSITNSDLDLLEEEMIQKLSAKLKGQVSADNMDSVIEVLKTNIQNIFNSFDENMQEFEVFKHKFNDIVQRYKGDTIKEMENLIQDMVEHISSSELKDGKAALTFSNESKQLNNVESTFKSFNNLNFTIDSTPEDESVKAKTDSFNTFVISNHCSQKELSGRNLLSEINIREKLVDVLDTLASTENLKKLAAKKIEINNYSQDHVEVQHNDTDIPIRSTNAKKDLYLDEDFDSTKSEEEKFFIFKICSYICKKIRRNPFA